MLTVPGEDVIVRSHRCLNSTQAQQHLEHNIRELYADGFVAAQRRPWPIAEPRAGTVIVATNCDFVTWIGDVVTNVQPRSHGLKYRHRFVTLALGSATVCYYEITGYPTRSMSVAFEHAFFMIDGVARSLAVPSAPPRFVAVTDVGFTEDGYAVDALDEFGFAVDDVDAALARFDINLADLREARQHLTDRGITIVEW